MTSPHILQFPTHPLFRGGHLQTLAGQWLPEKKIPYRAIRHEVRLSDNDVLILHDDCPNSWRVGDRTVLMIHGLGGCHRSKHLQRISQKLHRMGVRAFRLDLRGCGAGYGRSSRPYHAGQTLEVLESLKMVCHLCPTSNVVLVGFSLGGNLTLKLLGEHDSQLPEELTRAIAINPPIELQSCVRSMKKGLNRSYNRYFTKLLNDNVQQYLPALKNLYGKQHKYEARSLYEFDQLFTAPLGGYKDAAEYYQECSSATVLSQIRIPTTILTAADDPLVPVDLFEREDYPRNVKLHIAKSGGHMGYIARSNNDPDRRWMDWRVVEWATDTDAA